MPAHLQLPMLGRCHSVVHDSALIRCTREQLRSETVEERAERESATEAHVPAPNLDALCGMLLKVQGLKG